MPVICSSSSAAAFLRKCSERERAKLAELLGIEENQLRGKSTPQVPRAYTRNGTRTHTSYDNSVTHSEQKPLDTLRTFPISNNVDLPVFTTMPGGDGVTVMSVTPIDRIARPNFLMHVVDAYGLIIGDDAMDPEARIGSTILVHPHLPPRDGDTCLFRADSVGSKYVVRQLIRQNDRVWRVHQHKPAKDYELKKSEYPVCHAVVGNFSRR
jgi:phage repressor protein C with HTH and peptisase S24 domain